MPVSLSVSQLLREAANRLSSADVDSPRLSAELLLAYAMSTDRLRLTTHDQEIPNAAACDCFYALLERRAQGEPVAYLLGRKEFFSREFHVTRDTLIPRPETELLVETILADGSLPAGKPVLFADLGTGSGCIAITLAAERPLWRGIAADISMGALKIAAKNAGFHAVADRLCLVRADFCLPLFAQHSLDLVVSNPPYISREEYSGLSREVKDFEPLNALVPCHGASPAHDGLAHAAEIVSAAEKALRPGGLLLIEHGFAQRGGMSALLKNNAWINIQYFNDLSQKARFIKATRASSSG